MNETNKEFILLRGIPDNGLGYSRIISHGETLQCIFPGTADFINEMPNDIKSWRQFFLPIHSKREFHVNRMPLFVNYMGDPDSYATALTQALEIIDRQNFACFNHPRQILALRRDTLGTFFGHIDGLLIPKCITHKTQEFMDFERVVEQHGLNYPVIFRLAATHGGKSQTLVTSSNQWHEIANMVWHNKKVYITEFIDYRDPDGFYRKQRISVVGGEVMPRHGCLNYAWSVSGVDSPPETIEEEVLWSHNFYEKTWPLLEKRIASMIAATKLDYFGIDYSLRNDGKILLFEVTASMSMSRPFAMPTHLSIEHFPKMIQEKLADLLRNPSKWFFSRNLL